MIKTILIIRNVKIITKYNNNKYNIIVIINERKEIFYLTTQSTHFIYGYMASDIIS